MIFFTLKSRNNCQWKWHWLCFSINYVKQTKILGKGSGWIIDSVIEHIEHTITISKYNPLAGGSYIKLPKQLDHLRKVLINIESIDDNECFKWCLVRYVRIAKALTKIFIKKLDFKHI